MVIIKYDFDQRIWLQKFQKAYFLFKTKLLVTFYWIFNNLIQFKYFGNYLLPIGKTFII